MSNRQVTTATLGTPRIGPRRELKFAVERYWSGKISVDSLHETADGLREANWKSQRQAGIDAIPSNDFSFYDHVLDTACMVGAVPARYGWSGDFVPLDILFAMARGTASVPAMEMTKWFDTNYHYLVPELDPDQSFRLATVKPVKEYLKARAIGVETRPVVLGPVTFLALAKSTAPGHHPLSLLDRLLPVYVEVLKRLGEAGAQWVQLDEPCLVLDAEPTVQEALRIAYARFAEAVPQLKIMLTSYFGGLGDNLETALSLPVAGLHVDLVRAPDQLELVLSGARADQTLSLGVIDGRNIWRADLARILDRLEPALADRSGPIEIAPSCSLLHVPIDLELEDDLDADLKSWLAFAAQKMGELRLLATALAEGRDAVAAELAAASRAIAARAVSAKVHDAAVSARAADVTPELMRRQGSFATRRPLQHAALDLPTFPTTTIGSFPQTAEVRQARSDFGKGKLDAVGYEAFLRQKTAEVVAWQEEIGLDVLVHGEFERNDMVQYFGEQLSGFAFTKHAWVQSYGSRCVRPPVIFGDVSRPAPMTVAWWRYAQSLTGKPMKGMLTGPVTILNWSFVRDDLPRADVCRQIALAIRDEVSDLESAGARMIQIDEAALREGLPLKRAEWTTYLDWAVECFRLCSSGVADETQIHTHMCYSEFNDIIESIAAMDADVISIETSRSKMELLDAFVAYHYPNEIGPGVYDIHSPRVPDAAEMVELLTKAAERLAPDQIWVNPDCGLKTRGWDETRPALVAMVEAARQLRRTYPRS
uniref:5-methyltetrahydropteroyltriglutamate-- homocysteine S-methyltransferase n=1 Tax=Consotaella aegiceratis TaxID=3097961 RepID=UPI002F3ECABF